MTGYASSTETSGGFFGVTFSRLGLTLAGISTGFQGVGIGVNANSKSRETLSSLSTNPHGVDEVVDGKLSSLPDVVEGESFSFEWLGRGVSIIESKLIPRFGVFGVVGRVASRVAKASMRLSVG